MQVCLQIQYNINSISSLVDVTKEANEELHEICARRSDVQFASEVRTCPHEKFERER